MLFNVDWEKGSVFLVFLLNLLKINKKSNFKTTTIWPLVYNFKKYRIICINKYFLCFAKTGETGVR